MSINTIETKNHESRIEKLWKKESCYIVFCLRHWKRMKLPWVWFVGDKKQIKHLQAFCYHPHMQLYFCHPAPNNLLF